MDVNQLVQAVGQHGSLNVEGGLTIEVSVINAKVSYGTPRLEVTPVAGEGTKWVSADRVKGVEW